MNALFFQLVLIAEQAPTGGQEQQGNPLLSFILPVAMILMLGYFMLVRPEKRKQASHREMLQNLKKNDRVLTVGGMKGVVANVLREAGEVSVIIDESTGTKVRMTLDSIARVDSPKSEKSDEEKK
jgi:preprotein translocase subunit YajC